MKGGYEKSQVRVEKRDHIPAGVNPIKVILSLNKTKLILNTLTLYQLNLD